MIKETISIYQKIAYEFAPRIAHDFVLLIAIGKPKVIDGQNFLNFNQYKGALNGALSCNFNFSFNIINTSLDTGFDSQSLSVIKFLFKTEPAFHPTETPVGDQTVWLGERDSNP